MSLARYAGVGSVATLAHYALLIVLVECSTWPSGAASSLGALLGAAVAYTGNRRWTFPSTRSHHRNAIAKFAAVAVLGALINGGLVSALTWGHVHYLLAQCVATVAVLLLTYRLNRIWTFQ